jgi:hypothetical protein
MLILGLLGLMQAASPMTPSGSSPETGATIIMYRGSGVMGAAVGCPIRFHEREVVELGRGKFATWHVPAGEYILTNKTSSVVVNLRLGQTQYVRCEIKTGFMTGRADLQVVDQESFEAHRADFKEKNVSIILP